MNNIEILEEFIDKVDIYFTDDVGDCAITSKIAGIIEKLIQENKELKNKCNELNFKYTAQWVDDNFISKSEVKEKIEELEKCELTINICSRNQGKTLQQTLINHKIKVLQELLED